MLGKKVEGGKLVNCKLVNFRMNLNIFTIKAQEVVQQAITIAQGYGQQAIDTAHLLKAAMVDAESVTTYLFNKLGVNANALQAAADKVIASYPKVSGGDAYLASAANTAVQKAQAAAKDMGDEFVAVAQC